MATNDQQLNRITSAIPSFQEPQQGELDNPAFMWPGPTTWTMHGRYAPVRGYIRRLNEFYTKMGSGSDIKNRRCNFQFQPESFERTVSSAGVDTQFFFNQDPGQLTVPIPGQSTYTLKLMFNREAEVASGKYVSSVKNGAQKVSDVTQFFNDGRFDPFSISDANGYLTADYNKSWVCQIGVLADILVLDSIIGQGINKETITTLQNIMDRNAQNEANQKAAGAKVDPKNADEQDTTEDATTSNDYWSANSGSLGNNPNIGNTAFLVPSPVRIMLSNLMMVEGFVTTSSVNIHKFNNKFIPTQAVVSLGIQALYIGFAKGQTMLTTNIGGVGNIGATATTTEVSSGPDLSNLTDSQKNAYNKINEGIKKIYSKVEHDKNDLDLLEILTPLNKKTQTMNFKLSISAFGKDFIDNTLDESTGAEADYNWEGTLKMYWSKFVTTGTRGASKINAPNGYALQTGAPTGDAALMKWGTEENPLTIAVGSDTMHQAYTRSINPLTPLRNSVDFHVIGELKRDFWANKVASTLTSNSPALWDMFPESTIDSSIPLPFIEDKFWVELEIKISVTFNNIVHEVSQIAHFKKEVSAGDNVLFKNLTFKDLTP